MSEYAARAHATDEPTPTRSTTTIIAKLSDYLDGTLAGAERAEVDAQDRRAIRRGSARTPS